MTTERIKMIVTVTVIVFLTLGVLSPYWERASLVYSSFVASFKLSVEGFILPPFCWVNEHPVIGVLVPLRLVGVVLPMEGRWS